MWKVSDIRALATLAHEAGARCVCDNTVATPVGQAPFELGADLIVHATTKYLGGHGDLMGGAVVARAGDDELFQRVRAVQAASGGIPSPFDCWLVLRGIQTLPWRVRAHAANAMRLASFLADHRRVEAVHYPGLPSHPAHALAARQMRTFSGMLSFQVRGSAADALAVAAKVRIFTRATSFGGTDSLIEHRASVEGPGTRTPDNLLRVSVGLEHADDLIADLSEALS
jgi:cystathionine gamma-synthase